MAEPTGSTAPPKSRGDAPEGSSQSGPPDASTAQAPRGTNSESAKLGFAPTVPPPETADPDAALSTQTKWLGQLVADRYRITALLGEGGMGAVFRAEHERMRKQVALKILHREMTAMPEAVLRFEREAIASGRIHHPNVVNATDFGKLPDGSFYLVLDYVAGSSLTDVLAKSGPMPRNRALHIASQMVAALEAAHDAGVVHRDLKPDNVMLIDSNGDPDFVKVLDFGIAKIESRGSGAAFTQLTQLGSVFGTPDYMSPEQASGNPADHRADLYSVGIILYEMLSGSTPFRADNILTMLTKHLTEAPAPLPDTVSTDLRLLVERLLAKAPSDRFQSASELLGALRTCLALSRPPPARRAVRALQQASNFSQGIPRRCTQALELLAGLAQRSVPLGRRALPVWSVAAAAFGFGLAFILVIVAARDPAAEDTVTSRGEIVSAADSDLDQALSRAARGEEDAIQQLLERPAAERAASVWLSLGHGYAETDRLEAALSAYQQAVSQAPQAATNQRLLNNVLRAAWTPLLHERALDFAASSLASSGADLLYYIWIEKPPAHDEDLDVKAKKLLLGNARAHASTALKLALDLREATTCKQTQGLLSAAMAHADRRALKQLKKRQAVTGCGFLGLIDCYPCLRADQELQLAIEAVQKRASPQFQRPADATTKKKP